MDWLATMGLCPPMTSLSHDVPLPVALMTALLLCGIAARCPALVGVASPHPRRTPSGAGRPGDRRTRGLRRTARAGRAASSRPGACWRCSTDKRRALLAHEQAHLDLGHHRYLRASEMTASFPLLGPLARAVRFSTERWADEEAASVVGDRRVVARRSPGLRWRAPTAASGLAGLLDGDERAGIRSCSTAPRSAQPGPGSPGRGIGRRARRRNRAHPWPARPRGSARPSVRSRLTPTSCRSHATLGRTPHPDRPVVSRCPPARPRRSFPVKRILMSGLLGLAVLFLAACGDDSSTVDHGGDGGSTMSDGMGGGGMSGRTHDGEENSPMVDGAREIAVSASSFAFRPGQHHHRCRPGGITIVLTAEDILHDFTVEDADGHVAAAAGNHVRRDPHRRARYLHLLLLGNGPPRGRHRGPPSSSSDAKG